MQVVMTAGGKATRLGALAAHRPKVLLSVAGRVFLDLVLDHLAASGVSSVHLCLGTHAEQVLDHLRRHPSPLPVTTTVEPEPLGTAGCLAYAAPHLERTFLQLHGDTYTPVSFDTIDAAHRSSGRAALMTVLRNRDAFETSNVRIDGGLVVEYDKTARPGRFEYVDYGIAAFNRSVIDAIPAGRFTDLVDVFAALIGAGELAAYEVSTRFYEIGSISGYTELDALLTSGGRR
jgi:NDP-sugar pyrophosphorylase family protein